MFGKNTIDWIFLGMLLFFVGAWNHFLLFYYDADLRFAIILSLLFLSIDT